MSELQKKADVVFMALTIYREGRGESLEAQIAIGFSIMNRVSKPSWWGSDVQSVLFKKWQYSSLTSPNDPQLVIWPAKSSEASWISCLTAADIAYNKTGANPVPGADSYFDDSIKAPYWAKSEMFVKKIGRLNFYNIDQDHEIGVIL